MSTYTPDDDKLHTGRRLFRTVTALGAELRRQGAFQPADVRIDLVDLAYAAIAAADTQRERD
jgi:hypothetical protein